MPIDIDVPNMKFDRDDTLYKVPNQIFQPKWWDSVIVNVNPDKLKEFSYIYDQLPYSEAPIVMHKYQDIPVGPHFDVYPTMKISKEEYSHIQDNEPCGYRVVLSGQLGKLKILVGNEWITPELPSMPVCYLINSTKLKHKVEDDPGREVVYFRGKIDPLKHEKLLLRSFSKYSDLAIFNG